MINAIQRAVLAAPEQNWCLDLSSMQLETSGEVWPVAMDSGPREMLRSGRWDATSQLVENSEALKALITRLPYLNDFVTA